MMNQQNDEKTKRISLLLKLDSEHLLERIKERKAEYLDLFSLKRTREHFKEIFYSRYRGVGLEELALLGQETIVAIDDFYRLIEKLEWYFKVTEDQIHTAEDHLIRQIKLIEKAFQVLSLYLDAELGVLEEDLKPETPLSYISESSDQGESPPFKID